MLIIANTFLSCSAYASPPLFIASYYAKFVSENPEVQNAVSNGQIAMIAVASVVSTILVYFIRSFPLRIYKNKEQQYVFKFYFLVFGFILMIELFLLFFLDTLQFYRVH